MAENNAKNQSCSKPKEKIKMPPPIELALKCCANMKFHFDQKGRAFAAVPNGQKLIVFLIASKLFKRYIRNHYFKVYNKALNSNTLKELIDTLEARAFHESHEAETFLRVANTQDKIYVDLCNENYEVVEISAYGWNVPNEPKIFFIRNEGMTFLPKPIEGNLIDLKNALPVNDNNLNKILAWILGAYWGRPPFPILIIQGGQGSGKSTVTEMIRNLVDPSAVPLRGVVSNEQDLVITANSSHMLVMDNVSGISANFCDLACRIATGTGFAKRQLFTDCDEVLLKIANPIKINGIDSIPDRPDLLERSLFVELGDAASNRKTQRQIWDNFYKLRPKALGAIFTMLSNGLKALPNVYIDSPPRLADFAYLLKAVEEGNGLVCGTLCSTIEQSQNELLQYSIESNSFITALIEYLKINFRYEGTMLDLLQQLTHSPHLEKYQSDGKWPKSATMAGMLISRFEKYLNKVGISVIRKRSSEKHGARIIRISIGG